MLIEIARLADNSASGTPFTKVCVAAAEIFSRYPSSELGILFGSGNGTAEALYSL